MSWLGPLVAAASGGAAVALAMAHLRRVAERPSRGADALIASLRRVPLGERGPLASSSATASSWEGELIEASVGARSADARAVEIDAALGELEGALLAVKGWSAAALRLGLLGALLGAALGALRGDLIAALVAAAVGAPGVAVAALVGRRAAAVEAAQRRRADDLVTLLVGGRAAGAAPGRPGLDRARSSR